MLFELILTSAGLTLLNFEYLSLGLAGSFSALVILTLAGTEAVLGLSLAANASRSRPFLNLMTRTLKTTSLGSIFNSYIGDSPQPSTLSYIWNFGSLLAICLVTQIISGVILAIHYCPDIDLAFSSVEHIMRDVSGGWIIRYTHANVASLFFACVYAHIARGIYYASYKSPRIAPWSVGVVILVFIILTAFLGYCLVIGQISL
jgi:quinol-cytochrome oxidoreductase complex cytochrome b subunit